jgi:uncharacterized membrane protein
MERDLGRIAAFTDGVMAVAITLLVLNVEVPQLEPGHGLGDALVDEVLPSLSAYALAFALVGRFWVLHHNLFEKIHSFDRTLMALNLLFLGLVVLMPFSAQLYDVYTSRPLAAAVFGLTLGLVGLVNGLMTSHVLRQGFVHKHRHEETAASVPVGRGLTLVFFLSVPAAFLSVHLAELLWVSTVVLRYPLRRLGGLTSSR